MADERNTFQKVIYEEIYPEQIRLYGNREKVEYDFEWRRR
jgi:hypothetical protein